MNNIEFLRYEQVLNEKHIAIATIRVDKRFIFRFKILPKQDGSGYSALAASYKTTRYGKDEYVSSFQFDSSYEADEIKNFVIHHCMQEMSKTQASVFSAPAYPQQQTPNPQQAYQMPNQGMGYNFAQNQSQQPATQENMPF